MIALTFAFLAFFSSSLFAEITKVNNSIEGKSAQPTLLILGDSLSAGYKLAQEDNWPTLLNKEFTRLNNALDQTRVNDSFTYPKIVNGSISGDTAEQALERLPELLTAHQPKYVLIELGANNGMQGLDLVSLKQTLEQIITLIKSHGAKPILMQIDIPQNLGKRYVAGFKSIYPSLAEANDVPLIPFYMTDLVKANQAANYAYLQEDGIHPTKEAQPVIVQWMKINLVNILQQFDNP